MTEPSGSETGSTDGRSRSTVGRSGAGRRRRPWVVPALVLLMITGFGAYLIVGRSGPSGNSVLGASAGHRSAPRSAPMAPNGTFISSTGVPATLASFHGKPTMVWFVAGGCASCAASIPAVSQHWGQLRRDGIEVVTLGLYGSFASGRHGATQVLGFGRSAAGIDFSVTRPGWAWGMASEALSTAYDPSGTPDVYALIGPDGHLRYRNSVPVSTMPQLLAAAGHLTGHPAADESPTGHTGTGDTVP